MRGLRIGIGPSAFGIRAPYSQQQVPWAEFLDQVRAAGFEGVELGVWGYLPQDAARLHSEIGARRLALAAGALIGDFAFGERWSQTEERERDLCDLLAQVGATRLVLIDAPGLSRPVRHGTEMTSVQWSRMIDRIHQIATVAKSAGLVSAFHPHADTIIETEDEVEHLLSATDPALVALCLDTAHYAYFMGDPVDLIRRHGPRVQHVHIKNVDRTVRAEVHRRQLTFSEAVRSGVMTDLESGLIEFRDVFDALKGVGYAGWVIVEHDFDPARVAEPREIAAKNRRYLASLGM